MTELQRLRDRVEELEAAFGIRETFPPALRIRKSWAQLLGMLLARDLVAREVAWTVMYGHRSEDCQPEIKIVDVYVSSLRQALKPFNIVISRQWGVGHYLTADNKKKLRALIEQMRADGV